MPLKKQTLQPKKIYFSLIFLFLLVGSISAYGYEDVSLGTFVKGKCINLTQTSESATYINITSITYPNSTRAISDVEMIADSTEFTYNFCSTNLNGQYFINYEGNETNNSLTKNWFFVTTNGKESPSGIVIVSFSLIFLVIIAFMLQFIIYTMMFFVEYNFSKRDSTPKEERPIFTIREFLINISGYILLWVFYGLERTYLGNELMNRVLSTIIFISSWTNVFFPVIALIISFTIATWREIAGVGQITKW